MQDKEYYGEGGENMDKYRINIDELHKKRLGKNTLENRIVHPSKITEAYATDVYHYTSPEGVIGILKNREIFFTDSEYLNDYEERLGNLFSIRIVNLYILCPAIASLNSSRYVHAHQFSLYSHIHLP